MQKQLVISELSRGHANFVASVLSSKYTTVEERASLFQALLQFCITFQTKTSQESKGDLLEVTFRFACGLSDAGTHGRATFNFCKGFCIILMVLHM